MLERVAPLSPVGVPTAEAAGCVLGEAITAPCDVPSFANTAVDGYAVRAVDTGTAMPDRPVELPVVAEVAAGHPADRSLGAGEAMRIFTGAPLPDGADAVVMVEHSERLAGGARVALRAAAVPGQAVRAAGGDLRRGDPVFAPGEQMSPAHLGVLAALGVTEVLAHPRPRVGVLSTGDELVEADQPVEPGQIRDSNRAMLLALVGQNGWQAVDLGIVADKEQAITSALTAATERCDAVLTSGGVSMGDIDLVRVVLDRMGEMRWMQVAIRPAKPFAFGLVGEPPTPVFGLPGNPVSSLVSFELLARPALRHMAGHEALLRPEVPAIAAEAFERAPDGKTHFVRVAAERDEQGVLTVRSAGAQGSHQLTATARSNGLLPLPDGPGVRAGTEVRVLLLSEV